MILTNSFKQGRECDLYDIFFLYTFNINGNFDHIRLIMIYLFCKSYIYSIIYLLIISTKRIIPTHQLKYNCIFTKVS